MKFFSEQFVVLQDPHVLILEREMLSKQNDKIL